MILPADATDAARDSGSVLVRVVVGLAGVVLVAGGAFLLLRQDQPSPPPAPDAASTEETVPEVAQANAPSEPTAPEIKPSLRRTSGRHPQPTPGSSELPAGEPDPRMRQLVASLVEFGAQGTDFTTEQAAEWRQRLKGLVKEGAAAIPAIREFLAQKTDTSLGYPSTNNLGYASTRTAMFDALARIGGAEATTILKDTLTTSTDPKEIALVGRNLLNMDGTQNRDEVLAATKAALAQAANGGSTADVAPLFELLQKYGDASTVPELLSLSRQWNYYSIAALAQLPDGAGIQALIQAASGETQSGGARIAAIQMLAQTAVDNSDARSALLEQVRQNKLSSYNWSTIGTALAGDQFQFQEAAYTFPSSTLKPSDVRGTHIGSGNQNFYTAPPDGLTADRLGKQAAFIDELLAATSDANAQQTLQQAKALVDRRLAEAQAAQGGQVK